MIIMSNNSMKSLINKHLDGRKILIFFVLTGIIYSIMLVITIPKVMSFSGGMKILDMMPAGYDSAYVNSLLSALGEKGRYSYLFNQIPLDLIYPLIYGITFCLVLAYLIKKLGKSESYLFFLCYIPLFSGLFDYIENIGIITMLALYPANIDTVAKITNIFSILKSSSTTLASIILIILFIAFIIRSFKKVK